MGHFDDLCFSINEWVSAQNSTPWVFLYGDLGAGKTTLTGELLGHMGFDAKQVQSPTFLKVISYKNQSHPACKITHDLSSTSLFPTKISTAFRCESSEFHPRRTALSARFPIQIAIHLQDKCKVYRHANDHHLYRPGK